MKNLLTADEMRHYYPFRLEHIEVPHDGAPGRWEAYWFIVRLGIHDREHIIFYNSLN